MSFVLAERMSDSLPPYQRVKLIKLVTELPPAQFEQLLFGLRPPAGVVSPHGAPQGVRANELLSWSEGPGGCGLVVFVQTLDVLVPGQFKSDSWALDEQQTAQQQREAEAERQQQLEIVQKKLAEAERQRAEALAAAEQQKALEAERQRQLEIAQQQLAEAERQREEALAAAEQQRSQELAEAERKKEAALAALREQQAEAERLLKQKITQPAQPTPSDPPQGKDFTEDLGNGVGLEMVAIPAGEFMMGSPKDEADRSDYESPHHKVLVSAFWMGKFPVTQAQYQAVMGNNPSRFAENGANRPVENVSWHDAVAFCERLSQKTGRAYRLPSEAEWEYACRAGTTTPFYFGMSISRDLVNCKRNLGMALIGLFAGETTKVGSFPANAFGLHDMHGNVEEWCQDVWHDSYEGAPTNGSVWAVGGNQDSRRVRRGGSWDYSPRNCRSAFRYYSNADSRYNSFGFRVCCTAPQKQATAPRA
jgi:formylglycine-generating enzyme required for sulfatase activity